MHHGEKKSKIGKGSSDFDPLTNSFLFLGRNDNANLRQNQTKIVTVRAWTDRQTDRQTTDFIICPMLCCSNWTDNKVVWQWLWGVRGSLVINLLQIQCWLCSALGLILKTCQYLLQIWRYEACWFTFWNTLYISYHMCYTVTGSCRPFQRSPQMQYMYGGGE